VTAPAAHPFLPRDEAHALSQVVRRFLEATCSEPHVRAATASPRGYDAFAWKQAGQ
jgi:hypothetical protein